MNPFDPESNDLVTPPAHVVKAKVRDEERQRCNVEKPFAVTDRGRRANAMIRMLAKGNQAGALAVAQLERDRWAARRAEQTPDDRARRADIIRASNPDRPLATEPRIVFNGREMPLSLARHAGYTGPDPRAPDPETGQ